MIHAHVDRVKSTRNVVRGSKICLLQNHRCSCSFYLAGRSAGQGLCRDYEFRCNPGRTWHTVHTLERKYRTRQCRPVRNIPA